MYAHIYHHNIVSKTVAEPYHKKDAPKLWSLAEKNRLERGLMTHGYARWDKIMGKAHCAQFPKL